MRRLRAKKPKILADKQKLALLIKGNYKALLSRNPIHRYYWSGEYLVLGDKITIFWQNYVRSVGVDYISIHCNDRALTPKRIKELVMKLSK